MRPTKIEDVLVNLHTGQWFGWNNKDKVYANLVIHSGDEKPTKEWLESELVNKQTEWDAAETTEADNKANAKSKLAALGLSEDEISAAFGI
jgi:hypothetical protein